VWDHIARSSSDGPHWPVHQERAPAGRPIRDLQREKKAPRTISVFLKSGLPCISNNNSIAHRQASMFRFSGGAAVDRFHPFRGTRAEEQHYCRMAARLVNIMAEAAGGKTKRAIAAHAGERHQADHGCDVSGRPWKHKPGHTYCRRGESSVVIVRRSGLARADVRFR